MFSVIVVILIGDVIHISLQSTLILIISLAIHIWEGELFHVLGLLFF